MTTSIGFVLVTHSNAKQIQRLISRLNNMFDQPPIICHHDFAQCALPFREFARNVLFVLPPIPTGWGGFSVVEAAVSAIRLMYEAPAPPDWFVLLSGSDYPIKPAAQIRRELATCPYDANIHHELIDPSHFGRVCQRPSYWGRDWQGKCYERYFQSTPFLPFSESFRCYAGEFWFCANRRAAEYILNFHATQPALALHYQSATNPDESYFQCILANAPHFKLSQNNYRYVDWINGEARNLLFARRGRHPKTLGIADAPQLLSSSAHFARKFDINGDDRVLDELDAATQN